MINSPVWLASYPRSGNTLLRTILHQCFGLRSASIYPKDLGSNKALENYVGHIEHGHNGRIIFPDNCLPLIKTHEYPTNAMPAIYVVRDGRPASVSLWEFYSRSMPLGKIVSGQHRFGTWAGHLTAWLPWERPDTLIIKYEDLTSDLELSLEKIGRFLGRAPATRHIPPRNDIAARDGQWVRKQTDWTRIMSPEILKLFLSINGNMMDKLGYTETPHAS